MCLCEVQGGIVSQVVLQGTLEKRGFPTICSKLLNQIACKLGSTLWIPEVPKNIPKKTMLIGIDVDNNKLNKST